MEGKMGARTERLVRRLGEECERTLSFFRELSPEQWRQVIYSEGAHWTVREVLAHFVAAEFSMARLVENVLAGGMGTPEGFDLDDYNQRRVGKLEGRTPEELLEQFAEQRRAAIEIVKTLDEVDLGRKGRHPFLGVAPLEDIIQMMYRHNAIHQREIRKALSL
jgi:hypothetical protein